MAIQISSYLITHSLTTRPVRSTRYGTAWVYGITTDAQAPGSAAGLHAYQVLTDKQGASFTLSLYDTLPNFGASAFMANDILFVQGFQTINALDSITGSTL